MIEVTDRSTADVTCLWCGASLKFEDPWDFRMGYRIGDNTEVFSMECASCRSYMKVAVKWVPTCISVKKES